MANMKSGCLRSFARRHNLAKDNAKCHLRMWRKRFNFKTRGRHLEMDAADRWEECPRFWNRAFKQAPHRSSNHPLPAVHREV
eukprot:56022-Eustigmatos_ZCMA.PRE.1